MNSTKFIALTFISLLIVTFVMRVFGLISDLVFWVVNALGFITSYLINKGYLSR